jgi:anti-anti-sigma factor
VDLVLSTNDDSSGVLRVSGEVDTLVADELRETALRAARDHRGALRLNLTEVTFIDSRGLGSLIAVNNAMQAEGWAALTLERPSPSVYRALEITGLLPAFVLSD